MATLAGSGAEVSAPSTWLVRDVLTCVAQCNVRADYIGTAQDISDWVCRELHDCFDEFAEATATCRSGSSSSSSPGETHSNSSTLIGWSTLTSEAPVASGTAWALMRAVCMLAVRSSM